MHLGGPRRQFGASRNLYFVFFNVVAYVQFRCFHLYNFASGMSFFPSFTSPQFSFSTYMLPSQPEAQLGRNNWEIGLVEHGVLGRR